MRHTVFAKQLVHSTLLLWAAAACEGSVSNAHDTPIKHPRADQEATIVSPAVADAMQANAVREPQPGSAGRDETNAPSKIEDDVEPDRYADFEVDAGVEQDAAVDEDPNQDDEGTPRDDSDGDSDHDESDRDRDHDESGRDHPDRDKSDRDRDCEHRHNAGHEA